jgi:hypothetical protein
MNGFIKKFVNRPGLLFLLIAAIMVLPNFIFGPHSYVRWHDFGDATFPRYQALSQSFQTYGIHYWYVSGGGVDLLSNGTHFFNVFFAAFSLLPPWIALSALRVGSYFFAGYFMYRILREHVGLKPWVGVMGGLFFIAVGNGFPNMNNFFGIGAIPFLLWSLNRLHGRSVWVAYSGAGLLGVAFSLTAFIHMTGLVLPIIFGWLLFNRGDERWRLTMIFMTFGAFALLTQLDMLAAMVVNMPLSHRNGWDPQGGNLDPFFQWALQPLYLLPLTGVLHPRTRDRWGIFIVGTILVLLAICALEQPLRMIVGGYLPFLKSYNFSHLMKPMPFLVAASAAWGLNVITPILPQAPLMGRRITAASAMVVLSFLVGVYPLTKMLWFDARDWVMWGGYTAIWGSPNVQHLADEFSASPSPFRVASIQENGLQAAYANAYGLETADSYLNAYPRTYHSYWRMIIEPYLDRNPEAKLYFDFWGSRIGLWTDDGHPVLLNVDNYFRPHLLALLNVRYLITTVPLDHPRLTLLEKTRPDVFWDTLSTKEKVLHRLKENFSGRHVMVYRLKDELPRWFLAGAVRTFVNADELRLGLVSSTASELEKTVWLPEDVAHGIGSRPGPASPQGRVIKRFYSPDRIVLETELQVPAFLVVSNTYSPYWKVFVNGREGKILPAYGTLWAVELDGGRHTVEFLYRPPYALFSKISSGQGSAASFPQ